jgi:hypothetical protein
MSGGHSHDHHHKNGSCSDEVDEIDEILPIPTYTSWPKLLTSMAFVPFVSGIFSGLGNVFAYFIWQRFRVYMGLPPA